MAISRNLVVKTFDSNGNSLSKTITHVNSTTNNSEIDTFSRAYNNLSKRTYDDTIRIDSESVNEALAED